MSSRHLGIRDKVSSMVNLYFVAFSEILAIEYQALAAGVVVPLFAGFFVYLLLKLVQRIISKYTK
jgi:hypothetical protein